MSNDSLSVDWLELNNSGLTVVLKASPVMRSPELIETKEFSKTPVLLCMCVGCFRLFSS